MSGSLNKVILVGNLGGDPKVSTLQSGNKVANFGVATSERWKNDAGLQQEKTEWHQVVLYGKPAEVAERFLKKGSKVLIEGKLKTSKWTDSEGKERYRTEVIVSGFGGNLTMLGSIEKRSDGLSCGVSGTKKGYNSDIEFDLDDEIPF